MARTLANASSAPAGARVGHIANTIRAALSPILDADATRSDAQEAFQEAAGTSASVRMEVLVALASASAADAWTVSEINAAAAAAGKVGNMALPKSVATFVSESKRAMSPKVREHVGDLVALAGEVWAEEAALDKDQPRPCRKAFKRCYHMTLRMFGLCEDGELLSSTSDVVEWARNNDPDLDYSKVYERLQSIRKELSAFATDFPVDGFVEVDSFLEGITKDALKAARAGVAMRDEARMDAHRLAVPVTSAAAPARVIEDELASASEEDFDPIADALGELDAGMMDLGVAA